MNSVLKNEITYDDVFCNLVKDRKKAIELFESFQLMLNKTYHFKIKLKIKLKTALALCD